MVGLCILKHLENLSDQRVVQLWVQNPYYECFYGEVEFQWKLPCDHSDLIYFRQPVSTEGIEKIFAASIVINGDNAKEDEVCIDTTVQEKTITFPTDAKLYRKIIVHCLKIARANSIQLRRTYAKYLRLFLRWKKRKEKRQSEQYVYFFNDARNLIINFLIYDY